MRSSLPPTLVLRFTTLSSSSGVSNNVLDVPSRHAENIYDALSSRSFHAAHRLSFPFLPFLPFSSPSPLLSARVSVRSRRVTATFDTCSLTLPIFQVLVYSKDDDAGEVCLQEITPMSARILNDLSSDMHTRYPYTISIHVVVELLANRRIIKK